MVSIESILDVVPAVGVIVALVYYALTIRNQTKSRQTQIFMQLHEAKYNREGLEAYFQLINWQWEQNTTEKDWKHTFS
jgi:hypothetical protein